MLKPTALLMLLALLSGMAVSPARAEGEKRIPMIELIFEEIEPGVAPYRSRMLLSENWLRLDDGTDTGDFILFNRRSREILSYNHNDRTELLIPPRSVAPVDFRIDYEHEARSLDDAPRIAGGTPVENRFSADGKLCRRSINVPGFLPEFTRVLQDYEQMLAEQGKQTLARIPPEVRESCYMSNNFLHPVDYLEQGFPLFVINDQQRGRKLVGYQEVERPASLMQPLTGYRRYTPRPEPIEEKEKSAN